MKKTSLSLVISMIILLTAGCSQASMNQPDASGILSPTPESVPVTVTPISEPTRTAPSPSPTKDVTPAAATVTPVPELTVLPNASEIAHNLLADMTLEEKVGQLFFVRCRKETAVSDITAYHPGGYILFSDDFENRTEESIRQAIQDYQSTSGLPMLIGVDEEGGTVNRISKYSAFRSSPFESPQTLFREGGLKRITEDTIEKAKLLKHLGINVNLAPVSDVSTDPDDFIYPRAFGQDAQATSEYVKTVIEAMNSEGIGATLKHFPGYGNNVDTHTGIAIDNRTFEIFTTQDFLPFKAGIKAGAGSILVSHNIVVSMDKDFPASLSKKVHRILREDLDFEGVIMTDDLSMDAITEYTDNQEAAVLAINAGNDMVIASDFDVQIPAVIDAVKAHVIPEERINEAVLRVLIWKLSLGLSLE